MTGGEARNVESVCDLGGIINKLEEVGGRFSNLQVKDINQTETIQAEFTQLILRIPSFPSIHQSLI